MARVTIEDCLDNVENNVFDLINLAAARAKQISKGGRVLLDDADTGVGNDKEKPAISALREISHGLINNKTNLDDLNKSQEELEFGEAAADDYADFDLNNRNI